MRTRPDIHEDLVLAEASAWLARLQGSARTPATEQAFKAWLAEDPAHARAFARVTHTWDIIPGAAMQGQAASRPRPPHRQSPWRYAIAAGVAILLLLVGGYTLRDPVYRTGIGEQKAITLDDGTRITLNTDTRVVVSYRQAERRIGLTHGEAMFEVAKNPQRPFVVEAGAKQVRALGTTFLVRNEADQVAVVLIEGRVKVSDDAPPRRSEPAGDAVTLTPGERLVLNASGAQRQVLDRPKVEEVTAWRQGEVIFDNANLADAVAELNRYGTTRLRLEGPALARLRVSGVFATHDPVEFANAVAKLHDLDVVPGKDGVVLEKARHATANR